MAHIEALIKPDMLIWARKKSGFDLIGAAKRIKVKPERLKQWEEGTSRPTIKQAFKIAEVYRRPLSMFYMDEPPEDFQVAMKDFRTLPEGPPGIYSPALLLEHRTALTRRSLVIDLFSDADVGVFKYLGTASINSDPEKVGQNIRRILNIDWRAQKRWNQGWDAFKGWKESIERLNVLVFHTDHQSRSMRLELDDTRGFSISEPRFPIIVLNSKDAVHGRIFTLLHELVHIMLNEGGVCDCREYSTNGGFPNVEIFCNHTAGATLVPIDLLMNHEIVLSHRASGKGKIWEDIEIETLSSDFSVSDEALVRRLSISGLTSERFYKLKRDEYIERWERSRKKDDDEEDKSFAPFYRLKLRQLGIPFTRTVFSAYYDRKITLSDVMDYIGVKANSLKQIENAAYNVPQRK